MEGAAILAKTVPGITPGQLMKEISDLKILLLSQMKKLQVHSSVKHHTPCGQQPTRKMSCISMARDVIIVLPGQIFAF
jgi:hypothetical protein